MTGVTEHIDVAQIVLVIFFAFFALLVFHLQQESRREGFPLEDDNGDVGKESWFWRPKPKTFHLPHGHGDVTVPNDNPRDNQKRPVKAEPISRYAGSALRPTGDNPMLDSIGPGSYAERANVPDLTHDGEAKIVPMRVAKDFHVAAENLNPIGLRVVGFDGVVAGEVSDIWVDRAEQVIRYLEVKLDEPIGKGTVLLPMNFANIKRIRGREKLVFVDSIKGAQFADVPPLKKKKTSVTFLEEDKIMGYFGAGLFYADPSRTQVRM